MALETKQLSYFVAACQHRNHAEAAAEAGISSSALSENISQLEGDLGIALFRRGPMGHFPTEAARWLYQQVEPVLQRIEAVEQGTYTATGSYNTLHVATPLQFTLGRLARAVSLSTRAFRKTHPGIIPRVRFNLPIDESSSDEAAHVTIGYGDDDDSGESALLYHDDWIVVTNSERHAEPGSRIDFATLRRLTILAPALLPAQHRQLHDYCAAHGLAAPISIDDDVGTFPNLSRDVRSWALLAPRSLVAAGVARMQFVHAALPVAMNSRVIARTTGWAPARAFVDQLQRSLSAPSRPIIYEPGITLRQMRYFLALVDQLNITAAARKLHVVQPTLSAHLRKLETTLGIPLFERQRTGLKPVPAADELARLFGEAVSTCDQVMIQAPRVSPNEQQKVVLGVIPLTTHIGPLSDALGRTLVDWSERHARTKLQLVEAPSSTLYRWVESGEISFAIVETQVSRSSQLDLHRRDRLVVVSKAENGLLPEGDIDLAQCAAIPLVLPSSTFGLRQMLDRAADEVSVAFTPRMEVNSFATILSLVSCARMATILPEMAIRNIVQSGAFQLNPIANPAIYRRLSVVFSTDRNLTEIERDLVDGLRRRLAMASGE